MTQPRGERAHAVTRVDEAALAARLAEGDSEALAAVYDRYGRACYSLARRIVGDELLAEDVVQEVFLALWRAAGRYDATRGGFGTYLMSMTHHKAVDAVRGEQTRRNRLAPAELLDARGDAGADVVAAVWQGVRGTHVRAALGELPTEQREPLLLAYYGGYTQREIAGLTQTPLGTVKTRMLTGLRRLRHRLEGPLSEREPAPPPTSPSAPDRDGGDGR